MSRHSSYREQKLKEKRAAAARKGAVKNEATKDTLDFDKTFLHKQNRSFLIIERMIERKIKRNKKADKSDRDRESYMQ